MSLSFPIKKSLWPVFAVFVLTGFLWTGCPQPAPDTNLQLDSDASLKSLSIDNGTLRPGFNSAIKDYSVIVAHSVSTVTVTGVPNHEKASVSANSGNPQPLNEGSNKIVITVTAEDETFTTYTVRIERLDASVITIQSKEDLGKIGTEASHPLAGAYVLMENLELEDWTPIGSSADPFSGNFDGKGYAITLKSFNPGVISADSYLGIFGYVKGSDAAKAEIKNLVVYSEIDQESTAANGQAIGLIAGYAEHIEIEAITLQGSLNFKSAKNIYVGGIVGYAQKGTTVKNSNTGMSLNIDGGNGNGLVSGMYYNFVGGFAGLFKDGVNIINCHNTGNIAADCTAANTQVFCGGITGGSFYQFTTEYQGKIEDCSSTGNIIAKCKGFWSWAGGIAGCIVGDGDGSPEKTTRIMRCFASGTVSVADSGAGYPYVGGIVGYNYYGALTAQSYFTGTVIANKGADCVGGIAGYNSKQPEHNSRIEDCWSSGTVTGFKNAGGIVGQNQVNTFVRRCYSTAAVSTTYDVNSTITGVGGIAGMNASAETDAISGCVALNISIAAARGTKIHRVAGVLSGSGALGKNLAWSGMPVSSGDTYTADTGANKVDGADCDAKPLQSVYETLGWDFTNVWKMGAGGYPVLRWQN
jgi:hypothetical protein